MCCFPPRQAGTFLSLLTMVLLKSSHFPDLTFAVMVMVRLRENKLGKMITQGPFKLCPKYLQERFLFYCTEELLVTMTLICLHSFSQHWWNWLSQLPIWVGLLVGQANITPVTVSAASVCSGVGKESWEKSSQTFQISYFIDFLLVPHTFN